MSKLSKIFNFLDFFCAFWFVQYHFFPSCYFGLPRPLSTKNWPLLARSSPQTLVLAKISAKVVSPFPFAEFYFFYIVNLSPLYKYEVDLYPVRSRHVLSNSTDYWFSNFIVRTIAVFIRRFNSRGKRSNIRWEIISPPPTTASARAGTAVQGHVEAPAGSRRGRLRSVHPQVPASPQSPLCKFPSSLSPIHRCIIFENFTKIGLFFLISGLVVISSISESLGRWQHQKKVFEIWFFAIPWDKSFRFNTFGVWISWLRICGLRNL